MDASMDMDMRTLPGTGMPVNDEVFGNGRLPDMKNNFRDVDYRSMNPHMDNFDSGKEEEVMFGKNFDGPRQADVDFRNRFDNFNDDSPKYSNSPYGDRDSSWNQNDGYPKHDSPVGEPFGFRGNQNGSFGPGSQPGSFPQNFRGQDFRGPQGQFGNNFRPDGSSQFRSDGNWNNMPPRPDNFRNRGNFNQRMPMRGGGPMRNPRGFPGPRGGMWMPPPRGSGPPPPHSRGRNVF